MRDTIMAHMFTVPIAAAGMIIRMITIIPTPICTITVTGMITPIPTIIATIMLIRMNIRIPTNMITVMGLVADMITSTIIQAAATITVTTMPMITRTKTAAAAMESMITSMTILAAVTTIRTITIIATARMIMHMASSMSPVLWAARSLS
jgi:hypothetical protein